MSWYLLSSMLMGSFSENTIVLRVLCKKDFYFSSLKNAAVVYY